MQTLKRKVLSIAITAGVAGTLFVTDAPEASASSCSSCTSLVGKTYNLLSEQVSRAEGNLSRQIADFRARTEDLIITMSNTLQAEIAKQTQAIRSVNESIATYQLQEDLRREAVRISEKLQQPDGVCQTMAMSETLQTANNQVRERSREFTTERINAMARETSAARRIMASYERSVSEFCSQHDIDTGRCQGDPKVVNGDISAANMFGSATDGSLTYDPEQSAAVDAYIERLVGSPPPAVDMRCETADCKAFEEKRKDFMALVSLPMYSLSEISSSYTPQEGLARRTGTQEVLGKEDASMMEAMQAFIQMKFSRDAIAGQATKLSSEALLREIAQNQAFRLWIDFNAMRQMERIEAMQAAELAIVANAHMRQTLMAQRAAAEQSAYVDQEYVD